MTGILHMIHTTEHTMWIEGNQKHLWGALMEYVDRKEGSVDLYLET